MSAVAEQAPEQLELPAAHWSDPLIRRYVRALVRHHELCLQAGQEPSYGLCERLERLLEIRGGVR